MSKQKTYVVFHGLTPGIYSSWESCREQVSGYKSAVFRSFVSREEAQEAYSRHLHTKHETPDTHEKPAPVKTKDETTTASTANKDGSTEHSTPEDSTDKLENKRHRIEAILFRIQHDITLIKNILDEPAH